MFLKPYEFHSGAEGRLFEPTLAQPGPTRPEMLANTLERLTTPRTLNSLTVWFRMSNTIENEGLE